MDESFTLYIPLRLMPERITYYSLELRPERCPSWDLFYAFEHHDLALSPALRACDWRNGSGLMVLEKHIVEELASYAEPIMQRRYGPLTEVHVMKCECPKKSVKQSVLDVHEAKVTALLKKYAAKNAPRSASSKVLQERPKGELVEFPFQP
ncbi:hypothetical protein M2D07_004540 [Pseudomonas sp. BGr12]|uniref:hypothetical protein n=1 Tax=Pseudomonas sp. BGr12 TaxID=2936269 RepID=UPI002559C678|nr:hypothetical protein [Pseudomonas sp. BJa5]MDL2426280.1 hypothetical protein [Pseudomonas sp. BJa5]